LEKIEFEKRIHIDLETFKGLAKKCDWKKSVQRQCSFHREIGIAAEEMINEFADRRRRFHS